MKRLNVKLAVWLVGLTIFSVVGVHFLHGYQVDRNADILKQQAEKASKDGDAEEAIKQYNQYLRHRDDREGYAALAKLVVEVAKKPDATRQQKIRAYNILEEAIRRHDDLDEVRRSLVDYTLMMGRYADALDHIKLLRENGKDDPELQYKTALCHLQAGDRDDAVKELNRIVGFDPETGEFAEEAPASATEVNAFIVLGQILQNKGENAQANALMEKMVEWNPDSAEAHLARARFLLVDWQKARPDTPEGQDLKDQLFAESNAELDKAMELAPENADVQLTKAALALLVKDYAKARELLDLAVEEHPERSDVYLRRAELAVGEGQVEKAADELKQGLKKAENPAALIAATRQSATRTARPEGCPGDLR